MKSINFVLGVMCVSLGMVLTLHLPERPDMIPGTVLMLVIGTINLAGFSVSKK